MAVHGIWSNEQGKFVSPAEHYGYEFEHSMDNLVAFSPEGLEEWTKENSRDGFDMDRFVAENIELDYETGQYHLNPDADLWGDDYATEVEIEEVEVSPDDSMLDGDDALSALHNAVLSRITPDGRDFEWGDEEIEGWAWTSGDLAPSELGATRAVRIVINGVDGGGYLYQA